MLGWGVAADLGRWPPAISTRRRRFQSSLSTTCLSRCCPMQCSADGLSFGSPLAIPGLWSLWYVVSLVCGPLPLFSGFSLVASRRWCVCTARGCAWPAIQSSVLWVYPGGPCPVSFSPIFHATWLACGSLLTTLGHSPAGLGMDSRLGFASPCSLECMRPTVLPPRPRISQHRLRSQPSPNVGASA